MYKQLEWQDRVTEFEDRFTEKNNPDGSITHVPYEGEIIQVGTPQNQSNFNNMEKGIQDATLAAQFYAWGSLHQQRRDTEFVQDTETGIMDATLAIQMLGFGNLHQQRCNDAHNALMDNEALGELHEIKLTNSQSFPFNSTVDTPVSVALTKNRKNLYYSVETEVKSHTGLVGDIIISDKALNGFKIAYTGSGSSVTLVLRIKGGMT